ncbi:MAG: hypothetical protein JJW00_00205 [Sulfurimonas sp.]|nr:hypothetical protein [Sulfurimonas sp.]
MSKMEVEVNQGEIIVSSNLLAEYFGKSPATVTNWKTTKNLPIHDKIKGKYRYELISTVAWKKTNIKEKFSPNKQNVINTEVDDSFKINLPFDIQIGEIDLNNSQHLGVLALHPFGEMIRDTLKAREDILQKRLKTAEQKKELVSTKDAFRSITEVAYGLRSSMQNMLRILPRELHNKKIGEIKNILNAEFKSSLESIRDIDNCREEDNLHLYDVIEIVSELLHKKIPLSEIVKQLEKLDKVKKGTVK